MPNQKKLGFTLIELLVVISIIALLAALLQPVFISAKRSSLKSSCGSNLRQVGLSFNMYGVDNDDHFPTAANQYWIDHADNWEIPDGVKVEDIPNLIDVLLPYTHSEEVFRCPSDRLPEMRLVGESVVGQYPSQFAYDRTSYYYFLPYFFGKSQTRYASSYFVIARDFDSQWHCEYRDPFVTTPAYNLLFSDTHIRFGSIRNIGEAMNIALSNP